MEQENAKEEETRFSFNPVQITERKMDKQHIIEEFKGSGGVANFRYSFSCQYIGSWYSMIQATPRVNENVPMIWNS